VVGKNAHHSWLGRERSGATDIMCEVVRKLREGDVREDQVGKGSHSGRDGSQKCPASSANCTAGNHGPD